MNLLKTHVLDLAGIARKATGSDTRPAYLVTREIGQEVRRAVEKTLTERAEGDVLVLDFSGVGVIDFSCADEVVAKLLTRLMAVEYGDKYVVLQHLSPSHRENVQVALERKGLAVLGADGDGRWEPVGAITNYLLETLHVVMEVGRITARELGERLELGLTTASTRLIHLHKIRLVLRREVSVPEGGRYFVYAGLL